LEGNNGEQAHGKLKGKLARGRAGVSWTAAELAGGTVD